VGAHSIILLGIIMQRAAILADQLTARLDKLVRASNLQAELRSNNSLKIMITVLVQVNLTKVQVSITLRIEVQE
jgi:hypothetical protein